jgi:UDPglucose--hexose-1-phosphate uridylyltransferase
MTNKTLNEFRQDLVSGDWVLFATGRTHSFRKQDPDAYQEKSTCPFEGLDIPGQTNQFLIGKYPDAENWMATIIKNKFPAVSEGICSPERSSGPFKAIDAVGDHEVIVYRDHDKSIYDFTPADIKSIIGIYKKRFKELAARKECNQYILIFHNQGRAAGASIFHPHSQIITTPILPPDVYNSLNGSYKYYKEHKKKVYTDLIEWEEKEGTRIIYENENFIVFCPFVSKYPYELRIFSKESHAHFQEMPDSLDESLADAYHTALQKLGIALERPPFNMFIHTAPVSSGYGVHTHEFYHWHIEIIPHLKIDAGFELGTGIEVNIINPDESAEILRNVKL